MKNVLYRGTVLENVKQGLELLPGLPELSYLGREKLTLNPRVALGYAGVHFKNSGSNFENPPCLLVVNGDCCETLGLEDGEGNEKYFGHYKIKYGSWPPLNDNGVRIINPLNREGLELLLSLIRDNSHPNFSNCIQMTYCGRGGLQKKLEVFIESEIMPAIKRLQDEYNKADPAKKNGL